jgi:hypothetical protein
MTYRNLLIDNYKFEKMQMKTVETILKVLEFALKE